MIQRLSCIVLLSLLTGLSSWAQTAPARVTYVLEPLASTSVSYPAKAREKKIHGRVVAWMLVSETGEVENVRDFQGESVLANAAEDAIRKWKFKPVTKEDGKVVPVVAKVTLDFALSKDNSEPKDVVPEIERATAFPQRVRVSQGVSQAFLLHKVAPDYPPTALAQRVKGTVTLAVVIGRDGKMADVQLVSGPPELVPAAVEAVRQWRYRPYLLFNRPVEVQSTVFVNFTL